MVMRIAITSNGVGEASGATMTCPSIVRDGGLAGPASLEPREPT
jgi:hypothetical protein